MRLRTLCGTLCLLTLSATAFADGSAQTEATQRFKEGKALYAQGKIDDARLKFLQACAVLQDDTCMRNLSVAEYYSGHYVEAYRDIKSLLARGVLKSEPQVQREFEEMARQAYDKTGHIQVKGVDGSVVVIDEREKAGTCPISDPVDVVIGKHVIVSRKDDQIERREVDVVPGKITQVDLTPAVVAPPPGGGDVKPPPAGGDVKPPPGGGDIVPPGGGDTHPDKPGAARIAVAGTLVGLGVVSFVGGLAFGAVSRSKNDDALALGATGACASPTSATCAQLEDLRSSQNSANTMSIVGYVLAPILVAGGVATYFLWPKSKSKTAFAPVVSPNGFGLFMHGSF